MYKKPKAKFKIDTMKMVRRIRDEHARLLAGKTQAQRVESYRRLAKRCLQMVQHRHLLQPT